MMKREKNHLQKDREKDIEEHLCSKFHFLFGFPYAEQTD